MRRTTSSGPTVDHGQVSPAARPSAGVRVAAVEAVLDVARRPVHRGEITAALRRIGRTSDTLDHVSAALAHLNHESRAHPVGSGYWSAGPAVLEQEGR